MRFISVRRKPGWLAILPQAESIALAHARRDVGARPEILLLDEFRAEGGEVAALQRLRGARALRSYACTTLMRAGEYNITQMDAPNVPSAERKEAVRWRLKELVDYPLETACVDVLDIPMDGAGAVRQAGVFAVSAAEQAVRARLQPFAAARVPLMVIDVPELAQRNIAALFEDENRGLAFLRLDQSGGMLTLTFHGELIALRRVEVSAAQLAEGDAERRASVLERLVLELQRSLDNFDRQYSYIPVSKLMVAGYPLVAGLAAELGGNLYVPVHEMDLARVLDFPAVPELRDPQFQARHLLLIGAALRTGGVTT